MLALLSLLHSTAVGCDRPDGARFDVVTWNAWGLPAPVATDRKERLPRIAEAGRTFDFVGLQEVWRGARGLIADGLVPEGDADSGLAVLSRLHTGPARLFPFHVAGGFDALKQKGVVRVTLNVPDVGPVDVLVTHLQAGGSATAARLRAGQVDELLGVLDAVDGPAVVLGDFNFAVESAIDDETVERLGERGLVDAALAVGTTEGTWPGSAARYDRVYLVSDGETCLHSESAEVMHEHAALSDHLPLHVTIRAHHP